MGLAASLEGRAVSGGFEASQTKKGFVPGLDLGVRVGLGLERALGDASDGLVFLQAGFHADAASTNKFSETGLGTLGGSLSAAIPARLILPVLACRSTVDAGAPRPRPSAYWPDDILDLAEALLQ